MSRSHINPHTLRRSMKSFLIANDKFPGDKLTKNRDLKRIISEHFSIPLIGNKGNSDEQVLKLIGGAISKSEALKVHKSSRAEKPAITGSFCPGPKFYETKEWRSLRYRALKLHGARCQCCGRSPPGVVLHVDHIKPRSKYPELELELSNLQILCEDCNLGKSNRDDTDWRSWKPNAIQAATLELRKAEKRLSEELSEENYARLQEARMRLNEAIGCPALPDRATSLN
jgi:5-methylcytosine-specific restriction endonuclease McrA